MITSSPIAEPDQSEYAPYYHQYVSKVPEGDFLTVFAKQPEPLQQLLGDLPDGEESKLHEPCTWTLKQVLGHLIDVERIFSTRLLHIGVGVQQILPGIDLRVMASDGRYQRAWQSWNKAAGRPLILIRSSICLSQH